MGRPPFPTPDTLNAPPSWRCIDFISDLHLHEGLPKTTQALAAYLDNTPADAVLILGDLFEAWVGDDMAGQAYEATCVRMLAQAGQRLHLAMMVGNRDFLLGSQMLHACHAHHLADPTVLHAWGQAALLIHGDALCLADTDYLRFRSQVRQPAWQQAFLASPLTDRLMQAQRMREASQAHQQSQQAMDWADVDEAAATEWMRAAQTPCLIHGHTHRPGDAAFGPPGGTRHVLSDWDLDHGQPRAEVLRMSANGFERLTLG
jgi:UDP-2,3-diacylglucosamine hydrolase